MPSLKIASSVKVKGQKLKTHSSLLTHPHHTSTHFPIPEDAITESDSSQALQSVSPVFRALITQVKSSTARPSQADLTQEPSSLRVPRGVPLRVPKPLCRDRFRGHIHRQPACISPPSQPYRLITDQPSSIIALSIQMSRPPRLASCSSPSHVCGLSVILSI